MTDGVKPRTYHSPRRDAAARETRRLITAAAAALFVDRGYGATSMREVATAAGVAEKTLYLAFSTKVDLLRAVVDRLVAGDDEAVPIADRPWFQELLSTRDPRQALRSWVEHQQRQFERLSDLIETVRAAARSDPEIAALYRDKRNELVIDAARIIAALAERGGLRPGVSLADAAEHLNAITGPELYRLLVDDRGWTPARYRAWTQHALETYLLPPPRETNNGTSPGSSTQGQ